jgi:putative ABC transport system permease protein
MTRLTLRSLLSHKLRLALSALAIVLGVAFVAGTMIFTDTLSRTFDDLFDSTAADVNVAPKIAFDTGLTGAGGTSAVVPVPQSVVDTLTSVDGVAAVAGVIQVAGVYVLDRDGDVVSTGGAPGIGVNWTAAESLNPAKITDGRAPARAGEIALDTETVASTGYQVGDTVTVLTPGPRVEATLVGIFRFGTTGGAAGASLTAFDTVTAQRLLGEPGKFSGVAVGAAQGVTDDVLKQRVVQALGEGYDVKTQQEQASSLSTALKDQLSFFNVILFVFAGVALFVGTFIILNTFSMLVAQRSKELALLRALGASRRQVTRLVLAEAFMLGLVGATVGLGAGFGIAAALRALFATFGLTLDGGLVFNSKTIIWSYAIGVLVTMIAAYVPARRAARTSPVAAMRGEVTAPERSLRRRTVAGAALGVIGVVALIMSSVGAASAMSWVGLAACTLVIGAITLSPALAQVFLRTAGAVLPRLWGRIGHLARENALRNPRRTAATASALMVGLALVTGFGILGASTNASVDKLITQGLRADFVISTAVGLPFTTEVADRIAEVGGVATVMQHRFGTVQVDGDQAFLTAVDAAALDETVTLTYVAGSTAGLPGNGILVDQTNALSHGWSVGDDVQVLLPNGMTLDLTVGGIYEPNQVIGSLVVPLETYESAGGPALDQFVYVDLVEGASAGTVRTALEAVVADYPVVTLKDQAEFRAELKGQVDQMLLLINALLVLSVLIAVLGIINTLALAVIERTREIGLLRAVGMARSQLRRMIRLESVIISLYGAILGMGLGVVLGVALTRSLSAQGIDVVSVPLARLGMFLAVAVVIGVLAALWPARRAAHLQVLDAIATT